MIAAFTFQDREWLPSDVNAALTAMQFEADRGPHGIPMSEAIDPANAGKFEASTVVDYAQKAIDDHEEMLSGNEFAHQSRNGFRYIVRRRLD